MGDGISEKEREHVTVAFLYLDEKYLDDGAADEWQVTSLGGLLVTAHDYPLLRDGLFKLLPRFKDGAEGFSDRLHAANLFPDQPDCVHFAFYRGLVDMVNKLRCKVYRRGCNFVPSNEHLRRHQKDLLFFCFKSILLAVDKSSSDVQIWPVIEIDHSEVQDANFAGYVRWMDHATVYLNFVGDGVRELIESDYMVDTGKLGDVHYVTKQSIVGSAADCLLYLVHCKWLQEQGFPLSDYRTTLAGIASNIEPALVDDHVEHYVAGRTRHDVEGCSMTS